MTGCKLVFKETQNFCLSYTSDVEFHAHCEVYDWKLSVMKELYVEFAKLLEVASSLGFSEVWSVTPNPKFCCLFGGIDTNTNLAGCHIVYWEI